MFEDWPPVITDRQFEAWQTWLRDQWNKPDRSDHYLMRLMYEVQCSSLTKRPAIDSLKRVYGIEFSFGPPTPQMSQEERDQLEAVQAEKMMCAQLGLVYGVSTQE